MEDLIPLFNSLSPVVLFALIAWQITRLLQPIAGAYAAHANVRVTDRQEQAIEDKRRREHEDEVALKLAQYQKEQAELALQTALINAKIAEQLPKLLATSQQTLTAVEATGPQLEAVGGDLRTLIEQGHKILGDALKLVSVEQDTQTATLGRIEAKQDDRQAAEQAAP